MWDKLLACAQGPQALWWLSQMTWLMSHRLPACRPPSQQVHAGPCVLFHHLENEAGGGLVPSTRQNIRRPLVHAQLSPPSRGKPPDRWREPAFPGNQCSIELKERESHGARKQAWVQAHAFLCILHGKLLATTGAIWACSRRRDFSLVAVSSVTKDCFFQRGSSSHS